MELQKANVKNDSSRELIGVFQGIAIIAVVITHFAQRFELGLFLMF